MAFYGVFGIGGTGRVELAAGGQEGRKDALVDQQTEDRRTLAKALRSSGLIHHGVCGDELIAQLRGKHVGFLPQGLSRVRRSLSGGHG
jgi:hypothetical protein